MYHNKGPSMYNSQYKPPTYIYNTLHIRFIQYNFPRGTRYPTAGDEYYRPDYTYSEVQNKVTDKG